MPRRTVHGRTVRVVVATLTVLVMAVGATGVTVLGPMMADPARAGATGSQSPLVGVWEKEKFPYNTHRRVVFASPGEGSSEAYDESTGAWRHQSFWCPENTTHPDFTEVSGSWDEFTAKGLTSCNSGMYEYTTVFFRISASYGVLVMEMTWDWDDDGAVSIGDQGMTFYRKVGTGYPGDSSPPPPASDYLTCLNGADTIRLTWQWAYLMVDTASASGAFDGAEMAAIESDPCLLWRVSFGEPTATTVAEYQHSEPVAGSAARIWRCARFDITWPIRGPFDATEPIGRAETVTDACTDGEVLKGGDPTRSDPPATNVITVTLQAPYDSLWSHSPTGAAVGRYTDEGAYWEYRQIVQYTFLHLPTGSQDIVYTYILGLPLTPDGPPRLFWTEPR